MSRARPTVAMRQRLATGRGVFGELRRALRDERVALAHERRALLAHRDDDLAALAEGVRQRAAVGHGHRGRAVAVANAEVDAVARRAHGAVLDLAGELVGHARLGAR